MYAFPLQRNLYRQGYQQTPDFDTRMDEFPRYVLEHLIDNNCSEETLEEDYERAKYQQRENFVHGAEAERSRAYIRENHEHTIIATLEVRLVETEGTNWSTISAMNESFAIFEEALVRQYPTLLAGEMCGTFSLTYKETEIHNK